MKQAGFSLIEVLVATAIVVVGVASLAQLFAVSAHAIRIASATSIGLLLAEQKMAELRAGPTWVDPSPPGTLSADIAGYVDYLDTTGVPIDAASTKPAAGSVYVRRWSIDPLPTSPVNAIVLQVVVTRWPASRGPSGRGDVRLVSVKAQQGG